MTVTERQWQCAVLRGTIGATAAGAGSCCASIALRRVVPPWRDTRGMPCITVILGVVFYWMSLWVVATLAQDGASPRATNRRPGHEESLYG